MAAHNVKPAKNPKPHHRGGTIRQIQPITYIIGINKLGTLLSSQTTDTPGTTQTNVQDRSGATFQTYPVSPPNANPQSRLLISSKTSPTTLKRPKESLGFGLDCGGLAARGYQLFAVSLAATWKTLHPPRPHRNAAEYAQNAR